MVKNSLGLIEVVGLAAALEAADAAVKAANIEIIGYELTKGGGLVLIKLCGDVGAVKAGVEAGSMAASKVNKVLSTHVIPRPHQQLSCILESKETLGIKKEPTPIVVAESQVTESEHEMVEEADAVQTEFQSHPQNEEEPEVQIEDEDHCEEQVIETSISEINHENSEGDDVIVADQPEKQPADLCNLCNDPACHRKKGDPKVTCIYYGKNN
ncbi:BMC domain-containing protein [Pelosinus sp. sgz500959]|uniref:BMC domain-containing protein n=1 Tax=Pelosinus sp. sgz500959 TaxID=3242472 RepID=UPI00366EEB94